MTFANIRSSPVRGSILVVAMVMVFVGAVALSAWGYLTAMRLRQSEAIGSAADRYTAWDNSHATDQQFNWTQSYRDGNTFPSCTTLLQSAWGGVNVNGYNNLSPFRSTQKATGASISYPFNNLFSFPTPDGSVFFSRTNGDTDSSQPSSISYYDYLMTYPTPLLGDLFVVHKKSSSSTSTISFSSNIQVNGRVVVWESDSQTQNLYGQSCLCMGAQVQKTVQNINGGGLVMPQNWPPGPRATAGYGGSSAPYAITDGTMNMVNNPDFPPGSINNIMQNTGNFQVYSGPVTGALGLVTGLIGGITGDLVDLNGLSQNLTYPVEIQQTYLSNLNLTGLVGTSLNSILPILDGYAGLLNIAVVAVHHPDLPNIELTGSLNLIILLGDLIPIPAVDPSNLPPVIIWVDQSTMPRHILFVGQSTRRIILVTGTGTGGTTYCGFVGVTSLLGGPLPWRLQWINESTQLQIIPPLLFGYSSITGSMRTNMSVNVIDLFSLSNRMIFQRDTNPGTLETLLPRDAWYQPCFQMQ